MGAIGHMWHHGIRLTCGKKYSPTWTNLDQTVGWRGEGERNSKIKMKEKEGEFRERDTTFSLNFSAIRPAVSGGAREKVLPRGRSFA